MWQKIKNVLIIIGSSIAVAFLTSVYFLVFRGKTDGRRSDADVERDRRIQEGLADSEERTGRIEEGIGRAEGAVESCERHLQRAEEILRGAIKRSKEGEGNN